MSTQANADSLRATSMAPCPIKPQHCLYRKTGSDTSSASDTGAVNYGNRQTRVPGESQTRPSWRSLLPAVESYKGRVALLSPGPIGEEESEAMQWRMERFFKAEFDVWKVNRIHKHLWLAGQPRQTRSLHDHVLAGRHDIVVSEDANLHLMWKGTRLIVKPCPAYILSHDIWNRYLCQDRSLYGLCLGFLLSYVALVRRPSDFHIAQSRSLLPGDITWSEWRGLCIGILEGGFSLESYNESHPFNPRYAYGELRLRQVNWIYRFCSLKWPKPVTSCNVESGLGDGVTANNHGNEANGTRPPSLKGPKVRNTIRGLYNDYHEYSDFLSGNIAWLTVGTIYIALILTAMQVGLDTTLGEDEAFQSFCYGFTIFAIVAPVGILTTFVVFIGGSVLVSNWNHTLAMKRDRESEDTLMRQNEALQRFNH